ncbi:MAG: polysaccharide deacetylase family protein [Gammaproteobacteria bacterium]
MLQYHHVSESTPASTSISPENFRRHLDWLADNDFTVLPLHEAIKLLRSGKPLPDKSVAITFDDGYRNIYATAFPMLKKRGWPFTIFINPEPHDKNASSWASWDQLREMSANGAILANHTMSHLHMLRLKDAETETQWLERLKTEIMGAETRIREETGQDHKLFAYPYGESDSKIRELVTGLGYIAFGQQSGPLGPDSDFQNLPRFPLSGSYAALDTFKTKMLSLPMPVYAATPASESGDEVLSYNEKRPALTLQLHDSGRVNMNCFASGQGAIPVTDQGEGRYVIRPTNTIPAGRSRYNCTYMSEESGRFYWYSYNWVRRGANEQWLHD